MTFTAVMATAQQEESANGIEQPRLMMDTTRTQWNAPDSTIGCLSACFSMKAVHSVASLRLDDVARK
jgi:hypothetical protein